MWTTVEKCIISNITQQIRPPKLCIDFVLLEFSQQPNNKKKIYKEACRGEEGKLTWLMGWDIVAELSLTESLSVQQRSLSLSLSLSLLMEWMSVENEEFPCLQYQQF